MLTITKSSFLNGSKPNSSLTEDAAAADFQVIKKSLTNFLAVESFESLSNSDLVAAAQNIEKLGQLLDFARVAAAGEIDSRGTTKLFETEDKQDLGLGIAGWEDLPAAAKEKQRTTKEIDHLHGCKNTRELLQRLTGTSIAVINKRLRLAKAIKQSLSLSGDKMPAQFPFVLAGLKNFSLDAETASQITSRLNRLPFHIARSKRLSAELALVTSATGGETSDVVLDELARGDISITQNQKLIDEILGNSKQLPEHCDNISKMADIWCAFLDQDGKAPQSEQHILAKRYFKMNRVSEGLVNVSGRLLPEVAANLGQLLHALNSPKARIKELQSPFSEERTFAQKNHDALATIFQVAAKSKQIPNLGGSPVTVLMEINENSSFGKLHTHDGTVTPVSIHSVAHAACAGAVQKVVRNTKGKIVSLGSQERIFNHHQRRAITLRDGGCVIPGCSIPAAWCEIHHVKEHSRGGQTHTDNGVLLCWYHHRSLDTSGWKIKMLSGRAHIKAPRWLDSQQHWRKHRRFDELRL